MRIGPMTMIGIVLVVLSIVAFAYRGIPYAIREKIIDSDPVKASVETQKVIPMSPLMIGWALITGAVLIAVGSKES